MYYGGMDFHAVYFYLHDNYAFNFGGSPLVELLAPAGSWESLKAAVESGANAVYLAGKGFGARAFADNFDNEALQEAVTFAHMRNVAIHVTVNTVIDNSELSNLTQYLTFLYNIGVDAIIVQDLGVAKLAHEIVPNLPLHASTQMSINNLDSINVLEKLHFKRVVLAREVNLKDIKFFCKNTNIQIETFIHGAICVCYSGQCLMSSMIGGRSGNRGRCAQPCRLPYTLVDKNSNDLLQDSAAGKYLLSPHDMNTLDLIPQLIEAGISSFKIEGRMKKPEYVAIVVNAYRKKIDDYYRKTGFDESEIKTELSQIFNRDFTTGYLLTHQGKKMISDRKPNNRGRLIGRVQSYDRRTYIADIKLSDDLQIGDKIDFWVKIGGRVNMNISELRIGNKKVSIAHAGDVISMKMPKHVQEHDRVFKIFDAALNKKAKAFYTSSDPVRRIQLAVKLIAHLGQKVQIEMHDADGIFTTLTGDFVCEKALKRPLTYETVYKQINRLGSTIYELQALDCDIDDNVMVPISVLNDIRRQCTEAIEKKRLKRFQRPSVKSTTNWWKILQIKENTKIYSTSLLVTTDNLEKVNAALKGNCDGIIFGGDSYNHQNITIEDYQTAVTNCQQKNTPIYLALPRILRQNQANFIPNLLSKLNTSDFSGIYVHSVGQLKAINDFCKQHNKKLPIWTDYSLNAFNNAAILSLYEQNIAGCMLSPELNMQQIKAISAISPVPLEVFVQGNIELMVSEYCLPGSFLGNLHDNKCTGICKHKQFYLQDRKDEHFPVVTDQFCHMHILNGRELVMLAHVTELCAMNLAHLRIDGRYMSEDKLTKTVKLYKEVMQMGKGKLSLASNRIESFEGNNFTRGHFFRGIL